MKRMKKQMMNKNQKVKQNLQMKKIKKNQLKEKDTLLMKNQYMKI